MPNDYDRIIKENFEPLQMPLLRKLFGFDPPRLLPLEAKLQVTLWTSVAEGWNSRWLF